MLFRPTVRRLLESLLADSKSLTALSEETGLTKPALLRHLKELERLGVVGRAYRPVGVSREVVYTLQGCSLHLDIRPPGVAGDPLSGTALSWASSGYEDPEFPLTAQIPDRSDRSEVVTVLRALKRALPEDWPALFVVLFGSLVRGESRPKSDIDLMVVLPGNAATQDRAADAIAWAQQSVAHPIQPFFSTRASFPAQRKRMEQVAAGQGVVVHGDASERELWSLMKRYRTISI